MNEEITLRAADGLLLPFIQAWHDDQDLNRAIGVGRTGAEQLKYKLHLERLTFSPPADSRLLGAWVGTKPIAYIIYKDIVPEHKTLELGLVIDPALAGKGLGRTTLLLACDRAFDSGIFRVEFKPLKRNRQAINMAKRAGFTLEAFMKGSFWYNNSPVDQALLRLLKNERREVK